MELDEALVDRMCIVTREVKDERDLLRFVRSPQGEAVPDIGRKLPGRGVWVSLSRARIAEAQRKRLFSRGFGVETTSSEELPDRIAALLRKAALSYLSLAKKAGEAVTGFAKTADMLGTGRVRVLVHAKEAGDDGCRKLAVTAETGIETIRLFTGPELDLAFGRSNVVHAAVARGGLAEKFLAAARRVGLYEA